MWNRVLRTGLLLAVVGCGNDVEGEIRIGKVDVFAPLDCINGDELGFDGIEMWDDEGRLAHFVRFESDWALVFMTPDGIEFTRVDTVGCQQFDGALRGASWGTRRGHVSVQCIADTGRSVEGSVRFRNCGCPDDDQWDDDSWIDDDDDFWIDDDDG
jgi:hypothetical protein